MRLPFVLLCLALCYLGSLAQAASSPIITSFTPTSGPVGKVVTVIGANFTGATAVAFNGTPATTFSVASATSLKATVPAGTTTGAISITTPGGTAVSAGAFTIIPPPTLASFSPASGPVGTIVTVTGTNFTWVTTVKFNASTATFSKVSDTTLTAIVPLGATTGKITVTFAAGTATSATSFFLPPTITSFKPSSGPIGQAVTLTGLNFTGATAVAFTVISINPTDGAAMVWVPGGAFTMGTEYAAWWDAPQTQQVTLTGYWMYKYEVTVAQYRAFCAATSRALPTFPSGYSWAGTWVDASLQQHPIVNVTWHDAKAYADWAGVTLPTEAQWEYAARGPQGRNYPWGGTATAFESDNGWEQTKCANSYTSDQNISTWPVGSFPAGASWCGAHDLAGNVWEWCADWYRDYSSTPVTNPTGPASGSLRVLRGGSWFGNNPDIYCGAGRNGDDPGDRDIFNGFRCVSLSPGPNAPTITGFTPASGAPDTVVTLTGTNFTGAITVQFNGTSATTFTVDSTTSITATVPTGATTGKLSVTTLGGTATSATDFTVPDFIVISINLPDGATMVWVPGGAFTMGSIGGVGYCDEWPAHAVTLSGYWMYKYEVTVAQYRAFCAATGRALPEWPGDWLSWAGKNDWTNAALQQHPIVNVTWSDAMAYADWAGVTLPTEALWEYAARGQEGRYYPWGGTATEADPYNGWDQTKCANYDNSYVFGKSTWPVGSFPAGASWCGVHDLAGNVREWCADWYGNYSSSPVINPTGPASGTYRVLRGGSWGIGEVGCRGANRINFNPVLNWSSDVGFRCASLSPGP